MLGFIAAGLLIGALVKLVGERSRDLPGWLPLLGWGAFSAWLAGVVANLLVDNSVNDVTLFSFGAAVLVGTIGVAFTVARIGLDPEQERVPGDGERREE